MYTGEYRERHGAVADVERTLSVQAKVFAEALPAISDLKSGTQI
jgi:hypothetical protein